MTTLTVARRPTLRHLRSAWLTGAAAIPGALIVEMTRENAAGRTVSTLYAYAVPWGAHRALGILRGWSAQGASVGALWPKLRARLGPGVRVEVAEVEVNLTDQLRASIEAA